MAKVVLPGDPVGEGDLQKGVLHGCAVSGGVVRNDPLDQTIAIANARKRYAPKVGEYVVGIVATKAADFYWLDIRGPSNAMLRTTSFNQATKRHSPQLETGSIVYAQVIMAHKDLGVEVSCVDPEERKDWATYELYWGELRPSPGAAVLEVSLTHAQNLMEDGTMLAQIGKALPFEIAIGHNGRIWVRAESPRVAVLLLNAIRNAERMTPAQINVMITRMIEQFA